MEWSGRSRGALGEFVFIIFFMHPNGAYRQQQQQQQQKHTANTNNPRIYTKSEAKLEEEDEEDFYPEMVSEYRRGLNCVEKGCY